MTYTKLIKVDEQRNIIMIHKIHKIRKICKICKICKIHKIHKIHKIRKICKIRKIRKIFTFKKTYPISIFKLNKENNWKSGEKIYTVYGRHSL